MGLSDLTKRFLQLSQVLHGWMELLIGLEASRRKRIASYADNIAATLGRTGQALTLTQAEPENRQAARLASRELGRISGYVEDIVALLERHLDGRKLAGVKRRLDTLAAYGTGGTVGAGGTGDTGSTGGADDPALARKLALRQIDHLAEAEGYFRSLAERLRV